MAKTPTPSAKKSEPKRGKATRVPKEPKLPQRNMRGQDQALAAAAVAPRVSLDEMVKKIVCTTFYKHDHLTICVVEMANGFFITGQSAPASIENFNEDIGCELAYEDCIKQLWRLEGYALREKLHQQKED